MSNTLLTLNEDKKERQSLLDCLEAELNRLKNHHVSNLGTNVDYIICNDRNECVPKGYYDNIKSIYEKLKSLPF